MKKRWMSAVLAFALLVVPEGTWPAKRVMAEEMFEIETAASDEDSGDEAINTPEEIAGAAQENRAGTVKLDQMQESSDSTTTDQADTDPAVSGIQIESIEVETDAVDLAGDTEAYTETAEGGSGELYASGRIADAGNSDVALYARTVFGTSYGEQLTGNAAAIYSQMGQALTKNGCAAFTCTLSSPLAFPVYPTETSGGRLNWHIDSNEQYQNAVINAINQAAQSAYDAFTYDHPELFWLGKMSYEWKITFRREAGADNGTGTIKEITFTPKEEYTGAASDTAAFSAAVQQAVAQIRAAGGTTREDRLRAIHNYVCTQLTYEKEDGANARAWSAGGAFLYDHKVVCEGYAKMFKILCDQFQIPCVLVPGQAMTANGGWEGHMWNYVKMENGLWYLVDTTWDDQERETEEVYFLCGSEDYGMIASVSVGEERILYTNFSASPVAQSFALPELAGSRYYSGAAAHQHSWKEISRIEPDCETDGRVIEQCTSCLARYQEALPALGHVFTVYRSNGDATCTKDGTKTAVCDRCKTVTDTLPDAGSGGHRYVYTSNGDATVFADGTKTGRCTRCGGQKTVTEKGSRLAPTMTWNAPSILYMKKGQKTSALRIRNLARGDGISGFRSDHPSMVAVDKKTGRLTAKKTGTAKITVTLKSGMTRSFTVKVRNTKVKTTKITGVAGRVVLQKKQTLRLTPVLQPFTSQDKVTYRSSNKKVATVSAKGVVTAKKTGTAKITVQAGKRKKTVTVVVPETGKKKK
ncbi:MAG: Ig-like domain-containing protein [Lachnospiraceae bacterium]|nr:Ig-like domain-containing protein [Lachnospiraceae bacterium]